MANLFFLLQISDKRVFNVFVISWFFRNAKNNYFISFSFYWNLYLFSSTRKGNERDDSAPQLRRSFHLNLLEFFSEWCKGKYFYKGLSMNEQTLPQLYLKTLLHLHIRFAIKYLLSVPFIASVPIISFNSGRQYEINFWLFLREWIERWIELLDEKSTLKNHSNANWKYVKLFFHLSIFSFKAFSFNFFFLITKIKQTINIYFSCSQLFASSVKKQLRMLYRKKHQPGGKKSSLLITSREWKCEVKETEKSFRNFQEKARSWFSQLLCRSRKAGFEIRESFSKREN